MSFEVTLYHRPKGRTSTLDVKNIYAADEQYLKENNVQVSMEDLQTGSFAIYFNDGTMLEDNRTPDEITIISFGRSCEKCFQEGVEALKKRKEERGEG